MSDGIITEPDRLVRNTDRSNVIGIIDLGSNSVRLMVVRINANASCTVLNQVKHMVRLGEGGFLKNRLQEKTMHRTLGVLQGLAEMCTAYGVWEVIAVATAAVRDADNGQEFIRRIYERTGLDFTVISGREEARLIYLGVSNSLEYTKNTRLFIDIGGGSTELIVASSEKLANLDSLKLGCVRLTNLFFEQDTGPVSSYRYAALQRYIRNAGLYALQRIGQYSLEEAIGSSGTIQNLAEIASAMGQEKSGDFNQKPEKALLHYDSLRRVVQKLCALSLEERRVLPGINPNRADVIIAGAAILQTVMEDVGLSSIRVSNRNLQDGVLVDYLMRTRPEYFQSGHSIREKSVLQLARRCHFEERHSRHISSLALGLFDSAKALGLHQLSTESRELLHYAALLHDIGIFIAFSRHQAHTYYLIRNTELLGFTEREIEIMATTAYFHRKRPSRKYSLFNALDECLRQQVRLLSLFLILAERLDRTHRQLVVSAGFQRENNHLELRFYTRVPCPIEKEEMERSRKLVQKTLGEPVGMVAIEHIEETQG